jgi:hypothetical protein
VSLCRYRNKASAAVLAVRDVLVAMTLVRIVAPCTGLLEVGCDMAHLPPRRGDQRHHGDCDTDEHEWNADAAPVTLQVEIEWSSSTARMINAR